MRLLLTLLVLLVAVGGFALMRRSWRRQAAEAEDLPPLPAIPAGAERVGEPLPGLYVGTTAAGDWLRRVVAHGLSERSPARLLMLPPHGVVLDRTPGEFLIPAAALRDVRLDSAAAGKVIGAGGLIVLTWEHGGRTLESGFRADRQDRHAEWAERIRALVPVVAEPAAVGAEPAVSRVAGPGPAESAAVEPAAAAERAEPSRSTVPFLPSAVQKRRTITVPEPVAESAVAAATEPVADPAVAAASDEFDPLSAPLAEVELRLAARPPLRAGRSTGGSVPLAPVVTPTAPVITASAPAARPSAPALLTGARPPAVLVLEDGRSFRGEAYGAVGETYGEAVFSTGMTGYQETLTDPSYHRQVVVMTAPQIGNTGVNDDDPESDRIWVAGFVVRDPARRASDHRSTRSLEQELAASGVVGISGVDTRALTRHLRERGAMRVGLSSSRADVGAVLADVRESPAMTGLALAQDVTTSRPYVVPAVGERRFTVAALDLGIKRSTPRHLAELGVEVRVLPATASAADLLAAGTDGVFISNGPGDPAATDGPVDAVRGVLDAGRPLFGICFGNQLLGRALGLGTYKLGYGHRGVNQPVRDRRTGAVHITSHNHGFAVDAPLEGTVATPYGPVQVSHVALNDGVVEGLECLEAPAFSVQYHPEAAPGPHDATGLFARFVQLMGALR